MATGAPPPHSYLSFKQKRKTSELAPQLCGSPKRKDPVLLSRRYSSHASLAIQKKRKKLEEKRYSSANLPLAFLSYPHYEDEKISRKSPCLAVLTHCMSEPHVAI